MSELTSIAIDPVEAVPAGTPALQRAVAQEDCVRIGRATNGQTVKKPGEWITRGYQAELPVTGGSGTQIGMLRLHTQNVLKEPCQVHLVSSTGEVLMTCELPGLSTTHAVVAVQLSGTTYASCTTSVTQGGAALGVTMMYLIPGPVCGERTLATAQKLSERPNRAGIISICPLHNIVGV